MVGRILGIRYEITAALFDGPIFTTYAAKDRMQNRDVCIKVFKQPFSGEKDFLDACALFAARASAAQHPGVEKMAELDDHEGTPYLVGDLAKGTLLRERIRRFAPFSVPVSVSTAIAVCEPLFALHKAGIVHGDICAENVVMCNDGSAVLLNPGLWQAYSHSQTAGMVALPGMAPYLAPEVSAGGMPSSESDVYAVGVLLFELLTAHAPFRAETPVALAMKHAAGPTPRVRALNSSVPMVLDEIVNKALARESAQRYHSVGDLLSDLRYLQDALRFGRSLSWPIRPENLPEPQPVAPKMSAVRVEAKPKQRPPEPMVADDAPTSDVPAWMRYAVTVVVAMLVFFVGWWMVTSLSTKKEVTVPSILHQPVSEATNMLEQAGLKMQIKRHEASDKFAADTVISVDPPGGQKAKEGGTVFVVVSTGSKFVEMPNLMGLTLDEARIVLGKANLVLEERVGRRRKADVPKDCVVEQKPEPGKQTEQGSPVSLTVSNGDEEPDQGTNAGTGVPHTYTVTVKVTGTHDPVMVRIDMLDDRGTQTILDDEEHSPDDTVEAHADGYGAQVVFKIYYNGQLVHQETKKAAEGEPVQ